MKAVWSALGAMGIETNSRMAPVVTMFRLGDKHISSLTLGNFSPVLTSDSQGVIELRGFVGADLTSVHPAVPGARLQHHKTSSH